MLPRRKRKQSVPLTDVLEPNGGLVQRHSVDGADHRLGGVGYRGVPADRHRRADESRGIDVPRMGSSGAITTRSGVSCRTFRVLEISPGRRGPLIVAVRRWRTFRQTIFSGVPYSHSRSLHRPFRGVPAADLSTPAMVNPNPRAASTQSPVTTAPAIRSFRFHPAPIPENDVCKGRALGGGTKNIVIRNPQSSESSFIICDMLHWAFLNS